MSRRAIAPVRTSVMRGAPRLDVLAPCKTLASKMRSHFQGDCHERDCKNQKCDLSAYFRKKLANVDWQNLGVDSEWSRLRIFNADGHFAKDISRDVGHAGRRAIHGHGPLLWHL